MWLPRWSLAFCPVAERGSRQRLAAVAESTIVIQHMWKGYLGRQEARARRRYHGWKDGVAMVLVLLEVLMQVGGGGASGVADALCGAKPPCR